MASKPDVIPKEVKTSPPRRRESLFRVAAVDGRSAWVVAAAACWIFIINYGVFRSGGVFLVSFIDEMGATRQAASWPFTLGYAFHFLTGPAVSWLGHHFNSRMLASVGSVIASVGILSCYFAKDVLSITFLIGLLYGAGSGLTCITSVIVINKHFVRHRAKANGIQAAGSSLGALVTPVIAEIMLSTGGLKRTFIILSVIVFTSLLGSLLLKEPKQVIRRRCSLAPGRISTAVKVSPQEKVENIQNGCVTKPRDPIVLKSEDSRCPTETTDPEKSTNFIKSNLSQEPNAIQAVCVVENEETPLLGNVAESSSRRISYAEELKPNDKPEKRHTTEKLRPVPSTRELIMRAFRLPMFWMVCLNEIIYSWVKEMYFTTIVDFAVGLGIAENYAALLLSIASAGDLAGRLGQGFFIDTKLAKPSTVIFFALTGCGSLFFLLSTISNTGLVIFTAIGIGLCVGSLVGTRFLVVLEYLEEELLSTVIGLVLFIAGVFHLTRPFILGWFRDVSGSYTNLFYLQGAMCFAMALLWLWKVTQRVIRRCKSKREAGDLPSRHTYGSV